MSFANTKTTSNSPLHKRCHSNLVMIPERFEQLEKIVKKWISTCVASRTKTVHGTPINRENDLVIGNASLRHVWNSVIAHGDIGDLVTINADYKLRQVEDATWRVSSIRFFVTLPPGGKSRPREIPKPRVNQVESTKELQTLQTLWRSENRQINSLMVLRDKAAKEAERLNGWVREDQYKAVKWAQKLISGIRPADPTTKKVEMRAKHIHKRETATLAREANEQLASVEDRLQHSLEYIKGLEARLFLLMGEREYRTWFANETRWFKSPHYPAH